MGRLRVKLEQLKFAAYCFKKGKDARFVKSVKQLSDSNHMVYLESYGKEESDKPIYFIDMDASHSGFFADHNRLLALLYFADYYGMKPVVRYHKEYCYAESYPVNGTSNPFEYYFLQPTDISLDDINKFQMVIKSRKENSYLVNTLCETSNAYIRNDTYLNEMARITAKYVRLNDVTDTKIHADINELLGQNSVLAVHFRGTDFKQNYNGHPISIGVEVYIKETEKAFGKGNYDKVFLATDDSDAVKLFKEKFADKLVFYQDVIRSKENDTVMHSEASRENHHYMLGVEVLRDMYTLAACDGLVAGLSQVSYAARIQKKSVEEEYRDLIILNKGINFHKGKNCPQ